MTGLLRGGNIPIIMTIGGVSAHLTRRHLCRFRSFNVSVMIPVSTRRKANIVRLLSTLITRVTRGPTPIRSRSHPYHIMLLNGPGINGSSLVGRLMGFRQSVISPRPNAAQRSVSRAVRFCGTSVRLASATNVHHGHAIDSPLRALVMGDSFHTIRGTSIVLLLVSTTDNALTSRRLGLTFCVLRGFGTLVVLFGGRSLMTNFTGRSVRQGLSRCGRLVGGVPILSVSYGANGSVKHVVPLMRRICRHCGRQFSSSRLDVLVGRTLRHGPLCRGNGVLVIHQMGRITVTPAAFLVVTGRPS